MNATPFYITAKAERIAIVICCNALRRFYSSSSPSVGSSLPTNSYVKLFPFAEGN